MQSLPIVIAHQSNKHLVSYLKDGTLALDIGHVRPLSGQNTTLAILGRNGDVIVVLRCHSLSIIRFLMPDL